MLRKLLGFIVLFPLLGCGGGESPTPATEAITVAAAGDIASSAEGDTQTAQLIQRNPGIDLVLALGDTVYESGTLSEYQQFYEPTWGSFKSKTRPVPGNHEYRTAGAAGYFDYFGALAGDRAKGYYSFDIGEWHVVCLNTENHLEAQLTWLRADLSATSQRGIIAAFHRPLFNSGAEHGDESTTKSKAIWQVLEEFGVDIALSGHEHNYQRYRPQDGNGNATSNGIRQFVVGTGGRSLHPMGENPDPGLEFSQAESFGILELTLTSSTYSWRFLSVQGDVLDQGGPVEVD